MTVNKWEAFTGNTFGDERLAVIARELDAENYPEQMARIAERWILKGGPCKYGILRMSDFYPTPEQLETIGETIVRDLEREYRRGYADGKSAGWHMGYDAKFNEVKKQEEGNV